MTKKEVKAYIEILDNLKRDLTKESNAVTPEELANIICDKIKSYASGVYLNKNDELIVIPLSDLEKIRQEFVSPKPKCCKCKHFYGCGLEKQIFFNTTGNVCKEYKEANNGR